VAADALGPGTVLPVKGERLSLERIVNGASPGVSPAIDLSPYAGGRYAVLFLSPRGYHRIHMPFDGDLVDVRWHAGRFFPQNERALARITGVYERNERAVLRLRRASPKSEDNGELLVVLVGASVVGGIELAAAPRARWVGPAPAPLGAVYRRGDEIAHFTFGSTVIVLEPPEGRGLAGAGPAAGTDVRAGTRLWDDSAAVR
jgi:phosphatidylserine decarboxylase